MLVMLLGLLSICAMSGCGGDPAAPTLPEEAIDATEHRIEPFNLLMIDVSRVVLAESRQLEAYDVLEIQAANTIEDQPIDGRYLVENDGFVNLGPAYGSIKVVGLTMDEATAAIAHHLDAAIARHFERATEHTRPRIKFTPGIGVCVVKPDGTLDLGKYGSVHVQGKTLAEATKTVDKHLSQFFQTIVTNVRLLSLDYRSGTDYGGGFRSG